VTVSLAQFQENLSNGMALIRAWKPIGFWDVQAPHIF
jgi:hypothetical protein